MLSLGNIDTVLSVNDILSGLYNSSKSGANHSCSFHANWIFSSPEPALSPMPKRLNILNIFSFLGSLIPPFNASSLVILKLPGLLILKNVFPFSITIPLGNL